MTTSHCTCSSVRRPCRSGVGHLLVELRTGRFTGHPWNVATVAGMGPDMILDDLDPADSNLLILPGADIGMPGEGQRSPRPPRVTWTPGWVPVAAICGATAGLVRAGLLDNRRHTSAAAGYLMATGYAGGDHYLNQRAVMDGISSRPARSRLCSSRRCDAAALGPGIGSQARGVRGSFPPGRHDRFPSAHGRPRRSLSVAPKGPHCSAA